MLHSEVNINCFLFFHNSKILVFSNSNNEFFHRFSKIICYFAATFDQSCLPSKSRILLIVVAFNRKKKK